MANDFTPGPWVWRGKDGGLYQEGTTHRFGDAVMVPTYDYDSGVDIEVSDEDARLIAASPKLLKALELLVNRAFTQNLDIDEDWYADLVFAEDAIKDAKGE